LTKLIGEKNDSQPTTKSSDKGFVGGGTSGVGIAGGGSSEKNPPLFLSHHNLHLCTSN